MSDTKTRVKLYDILSDDQRKILGNLTSEIGRQIGSGVRRYRDPLTAGASPLQLAAFEGISGLGQGLPADQRQAAIAGLVGGLPAYNVDQDAYRRFYEEAVAAPARKDFYGRGGAFDQIMHAYGSNGRSGAAFEQLANAAGNFELGLAGQAADVGLRGEEARQRAMLAAQQIQPNAIQLSQREATFPIDYALTGGAEQRTIENQRLQGRYFRWQMSQPWANPWLNFIPLVTQQTRVPATQSSGGGLWS